MNAQVVHVDLEPMFSNHISKDVVHECLKGWWSVTEAKEHDHGFEETERGDKCCFPLILFSDTDVVITPSDIELGE